MAISRVTVWVAGQVLTADALNGEFNNILNNPVSLISPTTGAINFNLQSHVNLLPSALTATSGSTGQVLTVTGAGQVGWSTAGLSTGAALQVGYRVSGLTGSVTTGQTGSWSFDQATLVSTARTLAFQCNATSAITANVATIGAGGRDQVGNFASTFVHAYAISTGAGSTAPAAILSTQPPPIGPTLPSSYAGWALLGSFLYSSASTTFPVVQNSRGAWTHFSSMQPILNDGRSTAVTAVVVSSIVPPNALAYQINAASLLNNTANVHLQQTSSGGDIVATRNTGAIGAFNSYQLIQPIIANTSQTFFYNQAVDPTAGYGLYADIMAFKVANGDV